MTIKEFKDYPNTETPLNAENINDNFKEIKSVFNNQIAQGWYKTGLNPTFTFVSFDSTTKTGVVNTNLDLTGYLSVGMKIKLTQNGVVKYGFITAITSSAITLFMGTDYILEDIAISNTYYSMLKTPYGFPTNPDKWTITTTYTGSTSVSSPIANTWYNIGNFKITIPIGSWSVSYSCLGAVVLGAPGMTSYFSTLSTANNTGITSNNIKIRGYSSTELSVGSSKPIGNINLSSPTIYYMNFMTDTAGMTALYNVGGQQAAVIRAECNYL